MPGNPAIDSTTSEPVRMDATAGGRYPATGSNAGRMAWRMITTCSGNPFAKAVRIYGLRIVSSRLPRVMRETYASGGKVSAVTGSTR